MAVVPQLFCIVCFIPYCEGTSCVTFDVGGSLLCNNLLLGMHVCMDPHGVCLECTSISGGALRWLLTSSLGMQ